MLLKIHLTVNGLKVQKHRLLVITFSGTDAAGIRL